MQKSIYFNFMIKIAINGFGRIGRTFFRVIFNNPNFKIVAINDLSSTRVLSHLLKYDSIHGRFPCSISYDKNHIIVDGNSIPVFNILNDILPWEKYAVDLVNATRPGENSKNFINEWIDWGAGPRASQYLILGAKTRAVLDSRPTAEIDDVKSLEFAIVENVQRQDLNPIEEARGYQRLIDDFGYNQDKLSKFISKSRSYIANTLRLLSLPEQVLTMVEQGDLSAGHARSLIGLNNSVDLAKKIILKKLSVRQCEMLTKQFKEKKFLAIYR